MTRGREPVNTRQEKVLSAPERPAVPRGESRWAGAALTPPPPDDGPFLDISSVQTDFLVQLKRERCPEAWLFERRQSPTTEATTPADPQAHRAAAGSWLPWLCQLGEYLRCVRVMPRERREVQAELQALSSADVSVRLVCEERAARAIVPDVLVAGRKRAYPLVYDGDVVVGATVLDDLKLVGRWRSAIARLHAQGADLGGRTVR